MAGRVTQNKSEKPGVRDHSHPGRGRVACKIFTVFLLKISLSRLVLGGVTAEQPRT